MLRNLLNKFKHSPKSGNIYAVNTGQYIGEFVVVVSLVKSTVNTISLPKLRVRPIPYDAFEHALNNKIMTFIEKLPVDVFDSLVNIVKIASKKS